MISLLPRHVWTRTVQIQGDWSKKVTGNGSPERRDLKYLKDRYSEHTAKCYVNYFDKYRM
jgi:hypothetical protein